MSRITEKGVGQELRKGFQGLDPDRIPALTRYVHLLMRWNQRFNLIGTRDWKKAIQTLILDSLHLAVFLDELPLPLEPFCLDIGAGAGLPGIPLRIVWSKGEYMLVEPNQKRSTFLTYCLGLLRLERTRVRSVKVKELPEMIPEADLVLSRAFRPWEEFLDISSSLLSRQGLTLVFAGRAWTRTDSPPHGWSFLRQKQYPVQDREPRYFWVFRQTHPSGSDGF
ncbi:MAG: 16S rRNA (guanine(527)-N(7))-methyltransferase RsmG [Desulfohalobiaceae bacterium]|nr:16S rRNA (guanine(527)-N(7))-methyltransferase RsmG [Desulfohalobiaceae bacterium]